MDLYASDNRSLQSVVAQPKRFALLAYLALAQPTGFQRRDILVSVFWPELDTEHARAALRKLVHYLRQSLGKDVIVGRGDEELGLNPALIRCDAVDFERAAKAGRVAEAMELYRGDFLVGFHLTDTPEFEQWLEVERARLKGLAMRAAHTAAEAANARGEWTDAIQSARRALALGGGEVALRPLLEAHARAGDMAGMVQEFEAYRLRLASEYGIAPSSNTLRLVDDLRSSNAAPLPQAKAQPLPVVTVNVEPPTVRPRRSWRGAAATLGLLLIATSVWALTRDRAGPPVLAVGNIQNLTGEDSSLYARALPDLLATNLARAEQVQVISAARMYEALGALREDGAAAVGNAARKVGASQLVEGALYRLPSGSLRLDLRRVDLKKGAVREVAVVQGRDLFALVDSATTRILSGLAPASAALRVVDVTTRSIEAYALYQQGLRLLYLDGDLLAAKPFFAAALAKDSTFAMAAYYDALNQHGDFVGPALQRAAELSARASAREHLLIRATLAHVVNDQNRLLLAESLSVRYPGEPDGPLLLARARISAGHFLEGVRLLRQVVEMDSLALRGNRLYCRGCEALREIVVAYALADSIPAALRTARELVRLRPRAASSWDIAANALESAQLYDEALAAHRTHLALQPVSPQVVFPAILDIRRARFRQADSLLNAIMREAHPEQRARAAWYYIISLRNQGRHRAAFAAARHLEQLDRRSGLLHQAIVLFEMERPAEAADVFEQALGPVDPAATVTRLGSRGRAWFFLHVAVSHAAAHDTVRARAYADHLQKAGALSSYGRDPRLHHHVLGLLHAARGDHAAAVAEFRAAIYSTVGGYTRTNLELARSLLRLNRPAEAVEILRPAFHGAGLGASNLYVTHSELHETLGQAHEALGQRDSAAAHYEWLLRAWQKADPQLHARRAAVRRRLDALD